MGNEMTDAIPQDWIVRLTAIVEEAGAAILEIYNMILSSNQGG